MHKAICTVCGQAYGGFAAHSLTKTEAKAATYTETGNNEYYTCSVCQKVFKDAAGTQETTVEAETIAKLTRPSSGGSSSHGGNQPFNCNHLKPCPMLENPEILQRMVHETGAHSTDLQSPESVEHLCGKCAEYAKNWDERAQELWNK